MSKKRNEGGIDNGKPQGAVSILDDVNPLLSVMEHATKIQQRCAQFGFDWDTFTPVAAKVQEELIEVMEEAQLNNRDQQRVEEELGDLLFAVINLARHLDADPEQALRKANLKFAKRFAQVEQKVINSGKILQDSQLDELDALWQEVKREEKE